MELSTFSIPAFRRVDIQKRLEKLAKKAVKYGNGDISFSFGDTVIREVTTEYGKRSVEYIDVSVSGDAPKISGWEFLARVELLGGDENLIHHVPGNETILEDSFRVHDGHCDHCNTNRPRNDIYVMSDGVKQIAVGRSCLRDFLGIDDPKSIVNRAQFFEELRAIQDEDFSGFSSHGYFDLHEVLVIAAGFIRTKGYISKAKQAETGYETTGEAVKYCIGNVPGYKLETSEEDREWANKTLEFFRSESNFGNDYMDNIRVLVKQDIVKSQHVPIISSAVIAVQRKLAENNNDQKESNFVGNVKERLRGYDLTLEKIIFLGSGTWGPSYLHLMKDTDGNSFSWITSNKLEEVEGSTIKVDGTIKTHKVYNGTKQTVLTRVKQK